MEQIVRSKIKDFLLEKGISQASVARKMNITRSKLSLTLNGKRALKIRDYEKICKALDIGTAIFLPSRKQKDNL